MIKKKGIQGLIWIFLTDFYIANLVLGLRLKHGVIMNALNWIHYACVLFLSSMPR